MAMKLLRHFVAAGIASAVNIAIRYRSLLNTVRRFGFSNAGAMMSACFLNQEKSHASFETDVVLAGDCRGGTAHATGCC
jgi:hypothetical protein